MIRDVRSEPGADSCLSIKAMCDIVMLCGSHQILFDTGPQPRAEFVGVLCSWAGRRNLPPSAEPGGPPKEGDRAVCRPANLGESDRRLGLAVIEATVREAQLMAELVGEFLEAIGLAPPASERKKNPC